MRDLRGREKKEKEGGETEVRQKDAGPLIYDVRELLHIKDMLQVDLSLIEFI